MSVVLFQKTRSVNDPEGRVVKYEYDSRGNRTRLDYPSGDYLTYPYDEMNRLEGVVLNDQWNNEWTMRIYEYDELSRRTGFHSSFDSATYDYDIANRLEEVTNHISYYETLTYSYEDYDKVGNRKSCKIDDANEQRYIYDHIYQLMNVDYNDAGDNATHYNYDNLGNRVDVDTSGDTVHYGRNGLNRYTAGRGG